MDDDEDWDEYEDDSKPNRGRSRKQKLDKPPEAYGGYLPPHMMHHPGHPMMMHPQHAMAMHQAAMAQSAVASQQQQPLPPVPQMDPVTFLRYQQAFWEQNRMSEATLPLGQLIADMQHRSKQERDENNRLRTQLAILHATMTEEKSHPELLEEIAMLKVQLNEAQKTLDDVRLKQPVSGHVKLQDDVVPKLIECSKMIHVQASALKLLAGQSQPPATPPATSPAKTDSQPGH
jgi:hypothetical protein